MAVDASAIVGGRWLAHDGFGDVHHMTAQGVIAGANMVFVDVHPSPGRAGAQALGLEALGLYLEDVCLVREALYPCVRHVRARPPVGEKEKKTYRCGALR